MSAIPIVASPARWPFEPFISTAAWLYTAVFVKVEIDLMTLTSLKLVYCQCCFVARVHTGPDIDCGI